MGLRNATACQSAAMTNHHNARWMLDFVAVLSRNAVIAHVAAGYPIALTQLVHDLYGCEYRPGSDHAEADVSSTSDLQIAPAPPTPEQPSEDVTKAEAAAAAQVCAVFGRSAADL